MEGLFLSWQLAVSTYMVEAPLGLDFEGGWYGTEVPVNHYGYIVYISNKPLFFVKPLRFGGCLLS